MLSTNLVLASFLLECRKLIAAQPTLTPNKVAAREKLAQSQQIGPLGLPIMKIRIYHSEKILGSQHNKLMA